MNIRWLCILVFTLAAAVPPRAEQAGERTGGQTTLPAAFVNFNFDQVDIRFLVKLVGDLTGKRFVIDQPIEGKVTVVTPSRIPLDEVMPLFVSVLEAAGCALIERDGVSRIVQREARSLPVAPVLEEDALVLPDGLITKVIPLKSLNAAEARRLLEPMVDQGKAGALGILESTNHLIVTDTAAGIRRIEQILAQVDLPGLARSAELFALQYADATAIASALNQALAGVNARTATPGEQLRQRLPKPEGSAVSLPADAVVVAAPHSNSLILVGTSAQLNELKRVLQAMDTPPRRGCGHLQAVFLKYLSADEAAKSLTALLSKRVEKPQDQKISIESSIGNNALLVDAAPEDFQMVKDLLDQLDVPPQQVLIEVLIAELTLGDGSLLGAEFLGAGRPEQGSTIAIGGLRTSEGEDTLMAQVASGLVPNGLTFGLARGTYTDRDGNVVAGFPALLQIQALRQKSAFRILSRIPLWTQNNQEATVTIGKNIPILKSTVSSGTGSARDYIENIDRIDVGIKLSVTPHVNPDREVLMKLNPSIEAILESATGGKAYTPTIAKRDVMTTLTVPDGDTVVISGLMREDQIKKDRRIPILGSIPLIGWLFRTEEDAIERTNLLIFVTPRVAANATEALALTESTRAQTAFAAETNTTIRPLSEPPARP